MLLQNQVAIVTGATRGIGKSIVLILAQNGADLVINGNNEGLLNELAAEIIKFGRRCLVQIGDIADTEINLINTAMDHFGRIDVLANNAGINIVNVSSSTAKTPHRNASPSYGASKAGVNYLTQHLALEMAQHNIYVNGVCPGPIETDMSMQWTDEYRQQVLSRIPLGKLGKAKHVADAVLFLASSMSDFITGETININGGTYMN
jgi:3-oxoacyl-[acyl-carrier protein] reductase